MTLLLTGAGPSGPEAAGGTSALYQSLVAFWALDEASGNRADGIGSNTLTDTNTVTSNTGHVYATAADFVAANTEYLVINDNAALSTGDIDFWFAAWVYITDKTADRTIFSKGTGTDGTQFEYVLRYNQSADRFRWAVSPGNNPGIGVLNATTFGSPSADTWHLVLAYHDSGNNLLGVGVNGGTIDTTAYSGGSWDSTLAFHIGRWVTLYHNGRMGPVMMGKGYIPDGDDWAFLYNAGAGRTLAAMFDYAG